MPIVYISDKFVYSVKIKKLSLGDRIKGIRFFSDL